MKINFASNQGIPSRYLGPVILLVFQVHFSNAQPTEDHDYTENNRREIRTLSKGNLDFGYYWGMEARAGVINDAENLVFLIGGRAAWVIDHSVSVGFEGYGLFSDFSDTNFFFNNNYLYGGYGGVFVEPILGPAFPVHLAFPTLLGGGSVEFEDEQFFYDLEIFMVAEPGVSLEFNLAPNMRLGLTGRYRFTTKINSDILESHFLNGWSGGIFMKMGRF